MRYDVWNAGMAVALAVGLSGCAGAVDAPDTDSTGEELSYKGPYLALGDSVTFGYNPISDVKDLSAFVGYPEIIGRFGIRETSAACQGETSGSFINALAPDHGCHQWRADGNAMHVQYAGNAQSQLQFALGFLAQHPDTQTVSVGIGANDLLVLQDTCIAAHYPDPVAIGQCIGAGAAGTITRAAQNLGYILGAIRQSGYRNQLVAVTYYELSYANPNDLNFQAAYGLDQAIVQVAQTPALNASVARGFTAFGAVAQAKGGDSCAAGLLFKLPDGSCDKHPSKFGQAVLAAAIAGAVPAASIDLTQVPAQF